MPHSYTNLLVHCVFSTKDRRPSVSEPLQERLWPYFGGIAKENGMNVLAVGGVRDHTRSGRSIMDAVSFQPSLRDLMDEATHFPSDKSLG